MNEYIKAIGGAVILSALADMLAPEGELRKYCRIVCGFMVLAAVLSPLTGEMGKFEIDMPQIDAETAEKEARARILMEHKENLEKIIETNLPGTRAYVEVEEDGNIKSVTVENAPDEDQTVKYIRDSFGIEGERVKIK